MIKDVQAHPGEQQVVVARVAISPEAAAVLRRLRARHGPLLLRQAGGCHDRQPPECLPRAQCHVTDTEVLLGLLYDDVPEPAETEATVVAGENPDLLTKRTLFPKPITGASGLRIPGHLTPVWVTRASYEDRMTKQLLLDVAPAAERGSRLESVEGVRFVTRERTFDEHAQVWLETCPT